MHDGDTVALEGFTHLIPHAAGHEVIRQGRRDLTLVRMTPDVVYDQLIGMGCARGLVFSWGGNPGSGRSTASATRSSTAGPSRWRSRSTATPAWPRATWPGRRACPSACCGATWAPTSPERTARSPPSTCPFTGEVLTAVPALNPDVAGDPRPAGRPRRQRAAVGPRRGAEGGGAGTPPIDRHRRGGRRRARRPARMRWCCRRGWSTPCAGGRAAPTPASPSATPNGTTPSTRAWDDQPGSRTRPRHGSIATCGARPSRRVPRSAGLIVPPHRPDQKGATMAIATQTMTDEQRKSVASST